MIHYICGMKLFSMNRSYIYIFLFLIICGCSSDISHRLYDVESFISERPDSALKIVESMNRSLLKTKKDRAHHALLYAMALDKNYIDVTDDSIARVAVDYYSKKGPEKYEARALYYLGLSYYYKGEYDKAILEFTKAEKVAERSDSLYLGMTKLKQADTYSYSYNHIETLKCLQSANKIYSSISAEYYVRVTELRLAQAYYNLNEKEKAEKLLERIISNETNEKIRTSAMISYAFIKAHPLNDNYEDFDISVKTYEDVVSEYDSSFMGYEDYWAWAHSLNLLGRKTEARDMISQLKVADTSGTADYWLYLIEKSDANFESALSYLENSTDKIDKEVAEALRQSLALTQRDYYDAQSKISDYKVRTRTLLLISITVISLLLIGLILWITLRIIEHNCEEKEKYLKYANEVSRQLEASKNDDYPALKKKYVELYKSKFEMIGSLYEQYSLYYGKKNAEKVIYDKVVSIVNDFRDDYSNKDIIEGMLNDGLDDIMINLRTEMSKLKEKDYSVFSLLAIGFDVTTISHLLNTTMNTIYIRKSRIRRQIETVNPEHKLQFLSVFD